MSDSDGATDHRVHKLVTKFAKDSGTELLYAHPRLFQGWEMDEYIYECANGRVIGTNHGRPYWVSLKELQEIKREYIETVQVYEKLENSYGTPR